MNNEDSASAVYEREWQSAVAANESLSMINSSCAFPLRYWWPRALSATEACGVVRLAGGLGTRCV